MKQSLINKYAEFAVLAGINIQKGQNLLINSPVEHAPFARYCAEVAYDAGAREVLINYADEQFDRIRMKRTGIEALEDVKLWKTQRNFEYYEGKGGVCVLNILASDPEIYKGIDQLKISRANNAYEKAMRPWAEMILSNKVQWSIVAIPNKMWASKVFPNDDPETATEKLWSAIFKVCRVEGGNPIGEWETHLSNIMTHRKWLDNLNLTSLHFTSSNGTDLEVGLAENNVWCGGSPFSDAGIGFLPNIPTEEIYTAPHRLRTNGIVKSSMPFVYNGDLIEGITVRFKDGVAIEYSAEKGGILLDQMFNADEDAKHLGEIALVPASSPIRASGLLFYNTLFDENSACHIAFGAGFPNTIKNGATMGRDELLNKGVNNSLIHEDIMIGTKDMHVTGTTINGDSVEIIRQSEWAQSL